MAGMMGMMPGMGGGAAAAEPAVPAGVVPEMEDLYPLITVKQAQVLNAAPNADLENILRPEGADLRLLSNPETDEQLLITVPFSQNVKVRSMMLRANKPPGAGSVSAPKTVKIFVNSPSMDFNSAEDSKATQQFDLTEQQLEGERIGLDFLKFQNVSSLTIFIEDNQADEDVTFLNELRFYGFGRGTFEVSNIKQIGEEG